MIRNNLNVQKHDCFFAFDNILGDSDWARRTRRRVIQLSRHRFNTLISGPTGTGKRLLARALHAHGPRRDAPFIPVDCARLPASLFKTQMLGCVHRETVTLGCLRSADGGTLFLANVNHLDLESQRLLIRVLDTSVVTPHGSKESHDIDVRIIAATSSPLEDAVREGKFLPELFSRLCVLPFETVPLAERPEDILPIAKHLLAKITFEQGLPAERFSDEALEALQAYPWKENVDELLRVIESAAQLTDSAVIRAHDLNIRVDPCRVWPTLAELQSQHIRSTIERVNGDLARAAELLGISEAELRARATP